MGEAAEKVKDEKLDDKALEIALAQFFQGCDRIKSSAISTKGLKRAMLYALNKGLTTRGDKIKLKSDDEKRMAMIMGIVLDARLIMMGKAIKDEQENDNSEEGENTNE